MKTGVFQILTMLISMTIATPAIALPLQQGVYSASSNFIYIAMSGDRICYFGASRHGSLTASVNPDPSNSDLYLVNGTSLVLYQEDTKTLLAGDISNLRPFSAQALPLTELSPNMQQCLTSQDPYFEQSSENPFRNPE
ncbi:MAG: hypothetical protein HC769_33550 [Cyanobacteria bacterium CRU_2_1]|nr:hypothetical protein [Cyanobacteria bacterium RU_5_0]NJR63274.1 hypothetical protein [Cyanobacteria bacterium CRU_2_1]